MSQIKLLLNKLFKKCLSYWISENFGQANITFTCCDGTALILQLTMGLWCEIMLSHRCWWVLLSAYLQIRGEVISYNVMRELNSQLLCLWRGEEGICSDDRKSNEEVKVAGRKRDKKNKMARFRARNDIWGTNRLVKDITGWPPATRISLSCFASASRLRIDFYAGAKWSIVSFAWCQETIFRGLNENFLWF